MRILSGGLVGVVVPDVAAEEGAMVVLRLLDGRNWARARRMNDATVCLYTKKWDFPLCADM